MSGPHPASLGTRLALFFSLSAASVFVIAGWLIEVSVERHFVEQDMEVMTGKLDLVRHAIKKVRSEADLATLDERLGDAMVGHHGLEVSVHDVNRRVLFSTLDGHDRHPDLTVSTPAQSPKPEKWTDAHGQMRGFSASADTSIPGAPPVNDAASRLMSPTALVGSNDAHPANVRPNAIMAPPRSGFMRQRFTAASPHPAPAANDRAQRSAARRLWAAPLRPSAPWPRPAIRRPRQRPDLMWTTRVRVHPGSANTHRVPRRTRPSPRARKAARHGPTQP